MTTQPSQFILTTDFPTLKNDFFGSGTITIAGSIVIPGSGTASGFGDVTIGVQGSVVRGRISSTKNLDTVGDPIAYTGQNIAFSRTGTVLGSPASYQVFAFMFRSASTKLRFQVYILNPYVDPLTTEAGTDVIFLYANTFIPPYA